MSAVPRRGNQHRVGDRYFVELDTPPLTLVVSYNAYQRWSVVIVDRRAKGAVVDMHEASSLADAQHYAEGFVLGETPGPVRLQWVAQPMK